MAGASGYFANARSSVARPPASSPCESARRAATSTPFARPGSDSSTASSRVADAGEPQPVPADVDDAEPVDRPPALAWPHHPRDPGDRQPTVGGAQPCRERGVQRIRVGHDDDDAGIRPFRVEALDPGQVDLEVAAGHDGMRVGPDLAIGALEAKRLVETDRLVEVPARQDRVHPFARGGGHHGRA